MELREDGANPVEKALSIKEPETPTRAARIQNEDFEKELSALPPEGARERVDRIIGEWREKLKVGLLVSLNGERVNLSYDTALQCLDARELGTLYPLAALHECTHLPRSAEGALFELRAEFNDSEAVVFRFDRTYDRAAFALCLHALAVEARQDKWHEDWGADGWDEESDVSGREDGTNSTAEPEDDTVGEGQEKPPRAKRD